MPLFRLIGLALFITAIFLALAAAITKTTHIRVQLPSTDNMTPLPIAGESVRESVRESTVLPPPNASGPGDALAHPQSQTNQFRSVPIVWPLIFAAGAGLLMWFMLPSESLRTSSSTKRRSRRPK